MTLIDKDKEIEQLKLESIKDKEMLNEGEEKIKNLSLSVNLSNQNKINENADNDKEEIQNLKNKIIVLNKEKYEFNLKMIERENDFKDFLKQKENKINELTNQIKEKDEKLQELTTQLESIKINDKQEEDKEKKEENKEEKKPLEINDEVKDVEIPKQETEEHKLMIFNKLIVENLFLNYLLEQSANFGKSVREMNNNFDKYANYFIKDNLKVNNIFSSIFYEFLYRADRRADLDDFAVEIYDNNSISRSEDFKAKIIENDFYTKGYVNDHHINELNKKIKDFKVQIYTNIKNLVTKCHDFIKDTPQLENVRKFEPSALYTYSKSKLKVNLTNLNPNSIGYLVTGIKYITDKIKSVEFTGELNYDKNEDCKYTHEIFYQLVISHGEEIKELSFNQIKKFSPYKLLSLTYSTNYFIKGINILLQGCPKIKNVLINNCEITDDHLTDFDFQSTYKYSIINFSYNKIYKLKSFEKIVTTQLILNHNKIKFYQGDNSISCTYLDIGGNDISLKDFNRYMSDSKVQILNLSDIRISREDDGVQVSNALSTMRNLKILYLNNCQLQERSLKPLLNNLCKSEILEFYLSNNPLGDECMKHLSDFIQKCQTLLKIDLSNIKVTTEGLEQLVEGVNDNDSIKEINAENNPMVNKEKITEIFKSKEKFKINL